MASVAVALRRIRRGAEPLPLPDYQTDSSSGLDLLADLGEPITLRPGERARIPTGLCIAIPNGYEGQVRPRSGLAARYGVTLLNAPGTIDADYRGEIQVLLVNHGTHDYRVERGERIAQLVVAPVTRVQWREVEELSRTERGSGGFGHTGRT